MTGPSPTPSFFPAALPVAGLSASAAGAVAGKVTAAPPSEAADRAAGPTTPSDPTGRAAAPMGAGSTRRIAVVVNREAGTSRAWAVEALEEKLRDALADLGSVVRYEAVDGAGIVPAIEAAFADTGSDLVVVGGGDGTASTAAAAALKHDKPVCVLPLGTFNLFARLTGFPPDLDGTLDRLAEATIERIDVGRIAGAGEEPRVFLHHVTIGAHPRIVRMREGISYSGRWGKKLAVVRAWMKAMADPPRLRLTIRTDREDLRGAFASVAVTVNELAETPSAAPVPADPQGGRLALYATRATTPGRFLLFTLNALAGRWRSNPLAAFARARNAEIVAARPVLQLSVDGEPVDLAGPLSIAVEPGVLPVLKPRAAT